MRARFQIARYHASVGGAMPWCVVLHCVCKWLRWDVCGNISYPIHISISSPITYPHRKEMNGKNRVRLWSVAGDEKSTWYQRKKGYCTVGVREKKTSVLNSFLFVVPVIPYSMRCGKVEKSGRHRDCIQACRRYSKKNRREKMRVTRWQTQCEN